MSSRTSSLSTFTTTPSTICPSSTSTIVPSTASANDMPPRSSSTTWRGVYSPCSSIVPPGLGEAAGEAEATAASPSSTAGSDISSGNGSTLRVVVFRIGGAPSATTGGPGYQAWLFASAPCRGGVERPARDEHELRAVNGRGLATVRARVNGPHGLGLQPHAHGEQLELAWRVARRPQIGGRIAPGLVLDGGPLVVGRGRGVEPVAILEEPDLEVGRERGQEDLASRAYRSRHAGENGSVVPGADQPEGPLAQADDGVELALEVEVPRVGSREGDAGWGVGGGEVDEPLGDVDPHDGNPEPAQRVGVASRTAPDVEHPSRGVEAEFRDEEPNLLGRALRERIPQIRGPEMLGDGLEPMRQVSPPNRRFGGESIGARLSAGTKASCRSTGKAGSIGRPKGAGGAAPLGHPPPPRGVGATSARGLSGRTPTPAGTSSSACRRSAGRSRRPWPPRSRR